MWLRSKSCSGWENSQLCEGTRKSDGSIRHRRRKLSHNFLLLLLIHFYSIIPTVNGFCNFSQAIIRRRCNGNKRCARIGGGGDNNGGRVNIFQITSRRRMTENDNDEMEDDEWNGEIVDPEIEETNEYPSDIPDLSWRVEKLRLEEANTRRFLKAGPRFLPYEECRKWVQAWNRWDSEEEWVRWIDEGEKRNSYIPARPEEYYGKLGKWQGWDHFLGKSNDANEDSKDFQ